MLSIVVGLAVQRIPTGQAVRKPAASGARFTEQDVLRKSAALSGLLTKSSDPLQISLVARPIRERDGSTLNAVEAVSTDRNGQAVTFGCWDVVSGRIVMFSRNNLRGLPRMERANTRAYAIDAAMSWLSITDLRAGPSDWRITGVRSNKGRHWIVRARCGERKAAAFVDRLTGAVVSVASSKVVADNSRIAASKEGTPVNARRKTG
jgi:hypothetical protein